MMQSAAPSSASQELVIGGIGFDLADRIQAGHADGDVSDTLLEFLDGRVSERVAGEDPRITQHTVKLRQDLVRGRQDECAVFQAVA